MTKSLQQNFYANLPPVYFKNARKLCQKYNWKRRKIHSTCVLGYKTGKLLLRGHIQKQNFPSIKPTYFYVGNQFFLCYKEVKCTIN